MMWPIPTIARLAWAAIWLVFLGYPIADIIGTGYSPTRAVIAWICLVGFAATYLVRDVDLPLAGPARRDRPCCSCRSRRSSWRASPSRWSSGGSGAEFWCTAASAPGGRCAGAFLVPVLFALGVFMVVSGALLGYAWADLGFITFLTVALGFTMLAFRRLIATVIELRSARAEVARLAIADERLRISRDVHDILGHSLSVIALKAQVARRLMTQ